MSKHPIILLIHFLMELVAWFSLGYWGWMQSQGLVRWLLGIGLPLIAMVLWGTFRVPGDPGNAPVAVPGIVRLALETMIFFGGALALYLAGQPLLGIAMAIILLLLYLAEYDRVLWLLQQK